MFTYQRKGKRMNNLVVFNDSRQSVGFRKGVALINKKLEKHELRVKLQFIEDYESDEGEFAWAVSIVPDDLPVSERELPISRREEDA
jgi:hypothetical protein